ncbi:Mrp family chromosome partitioning ATPase [Sphingomonas kaistensis]|uniref:Mrp family chromosome partitioning ATPase n=1 Tax=Sphingomonas kaistensis TaxID=298708 RepID=A0A7X6BFI5_9SPHN|nr:CpsD/CapB family tyrosine-protein kinase [Sphingomonas kaistensis]NJC04490.1 Mrp family chromosome partitioning ATPase [Sphingomonas kaistensis]
MHSSINQIPGDAADRHSTPDQFVADALDSPEVLGWSPERALSGGIYGFNSIDPRSRSFNLVRGRLLELKRSRNMRLVGVVSATPNVGKSFVAANISASLSRDPQIRTYAVDLDLRRGSLSTQFGIIPENGLNEYLAGGGRFETYALDGEALTIIPTRGGMVHSAELLASARARGMFQAMRRSNPDNLFVCDLPPVFANDDAVASMAYLDAYILVSEEGLTTEREIKDSVDALGRQKLAGVVLNKFKGGVLSDGYGVENYYAVGYGVERDN